MDTFTKNIVNLHGEKGKQWLDSLPQQIERLKALWGLTEITPVDNMSWNYVAKAIQDNNSPVVLKISCDKDLIDHEYQALMHFNGHGSVNAIDYNSKCNALLLKQAMPGTILKDITSKSTQKVISIYSNVVNALASTAKPDIVQFEHISKWLKAIDRIKSNLIDKQLVQLAKTLKTELLNTSNNEYLCHGDLHLENVIQDQNQWVAIDPKGIIAEKEFEVSAFDLLSKDELNSNDCTNLIKKRIQLLAKTTRTDKTKLLKWIFLRIIMSAQWFIEDNGDPTFMLKLVIIIYPLVTESY